MVQEVLQYLHGKHGYDGLDDEYHELVGPAATTGHGEASPAGGVVGDAAPAAATAAAGVAASTAAASCAPAATSPFAWRYDGDADDGERSPAPAPTAAASAATASLPVATAAATPTTVGMGAVSAPVASAPAATSVDGTGPMCGGADADDSDDPTARETAFAIPSGSGHSPAQPR